MGDNLVPIGLSRGLQGRLLDFLDAELLASQNG